ncbi:FecR family protein [Methylobacterium sp. A54F]
MGERRDPEASDEAQDDPIYEEAAIWVARLSSSDATEADRKAFDVWRSADPAHAEAYAELDEWHRTLGRVPDPRERKRGKPKGLAVLAAALGLSGLVAYETGLIDRLRADAWTGVGGFETKMLADGSRVDLNTDTALALRYTLGERGVELLRGEAVFDVVPDHDRPFVVRGSGLSVRAVGTRFYVRADGAPEPVGVAEGRVDAATEAGRATIGAGEIARRGADDRLVAARGDVEKTIAWREAKLVASGQPLSAVLADLNRYRHGRIVLLDAALGARPFSGTLDLRDTDDALDVLATSMRLRIIRLTPVLVFVRAAS